MRIKTILSCMALTLLFALSSSLALAESRAGFFELSPFLNYTWFDDDLKLDDGHGLGARLGYFYDDNWEVEAAMSFVDSELDSGEDADALTTQLDVLYNFDYGQIVPYLAGGIGYAEFDSDGELIADIGGGVRYFFNETMALRGDLREIHVFDDSDWNFVASLAISFFFGEDSEPEPLAPVDSDGDGVIDENDKCPDTPTGVKVDAKGCRVDSDGDGVWDEDDKCAGTPKGVKVDSKGCRVDSDGDGVWDEDDKCAGTPKGVKVDSKGCRVDSDGDGVWEEDDKCANTPAGAKVDAMGCRVDTDGDGVWDENDKCAGTPKGVKVDSKGCRVDSDGDGVWDDDDKCAGTPKGVKVDGKGCRVDSDGDGVWDEDDECKTTPSGVPVDKTGCNIKKVTIELNVEFDTAKAVIRPQSFVEIDKAGEFLKKYTATNGVIEGHTDSQGSNEYNQKLSQSRAEAVRDYLVEKFQLEPSRLTAKGFGEDRPIATNDTVEGRQKNRRIEAVFTTQIRQ